MYKVLKDLFSKETCAVFKLNENKSIPFDPDNTDYQTFKKDLANGVTLNDAEGNAMTPEQITTFLGTLK